MSNINVRSVCSTPPKAAVSVLTTADTVIPANLSAIERIICMVGFTSPVMVAYADSTSGGTAYNYILYPSFFGLFPGDTVFITSYNGPIALRAIWDAVDVAWSEV